MVITSFQKDSLATLNTASISRPFLLLKSPEKYHLLINTAPFFMPIKHLHISLRVRRLGHHTSSRQATSQSLLLTGYGT